MWAKVHLTSTMIEHRELSFVTFRVHDDYRHRRQLNGVFIEVDTEFTNVMQRITIYFHPSFENCSRPHPVLCYCLACSEISQDKQVGHLIEPIRPKKIFKKRNFASGYLKRYNAMYRIKTRLCFMIIFQMEMVLSELAR